MNDSRRRDLARRLRRSLDGALVTEVVPSSPAASAGLSASTRSGYGSMKLQVPIVDSLPQLRLVSMR